MRLGGTTHTQTVDRVSTSRTTPRCSAVAQPPRRGSVKTSSDYLQAAEEAELQPSTSAPASLSAADLGMRMNLARLERSFNSSRHGGRSLRLGLFAPDAFLVTLEDKPQQTRNQEKTAEYFANLGDAIRTLRDDIPSLFEHDLNYGIYRDDILFKDPRNSFQGIKNYKLIFWSLRFHGRIFFRKLYVEVRRIWQPPTDDSIIKMRWTVHGIPRVPWEAEGTFDGISTYKLDENGKVYEHVVDNVLLRDPPMQRNPLLAGLYLAPLEPAAGRTPQLGVGSMFTDERELSALTADAACAAAPSQPAPPHQQHQQQLQQPHQQPQRHWLSSVTFSWVRLYAALLATVQLTAGLLSFHDTESSGHELPEASMTGSS